MKILNETQKKWILTASLASLLSFNLLMSFGASATHSADFASTSTKTAKLATEGGGELKLTFRQYSEDEVEVHYDPRKTEANVVSPGLCTVCGTAVMKGKITQSAKELATAFKAQYGKDLKIVDSKETELANGSGNDNDSSNSKDINELKEMVKTLAQQVADNNKKGKEDNTGDDEEKPRKSKRTRSEKNEDLARIEKTCGKIKDRDKKIDCAGEALAKLLSEDSDGKIKEGDAFATWEKTLKGSLIDALGDTSNPVAQKFAQDTLKDMLKSVEPEQYDSIRKNLVVSATQTVQDAYTKAQELGKDAKFNPAARFAYEQQIARAQGLQRQLGSVLGKSITVAGDKDMMRKGYELPTRAINAAYANYKPYPALPELTNEIYNGDFTLPKATSREATASATTTTATGTVKQTFVHTLPHNANQPDYVPSGTLAETSDVKGSGEIKAAGQATPGAVGMLRRQAPQQGAPAAGFPARPRQ